MNGRVGRYGKIIALSMGGYLGLLLGLGWALDGCVANMVEQRMSAALGADVDVGEVSLSLIRGRIEVHEIRVQRQTLGHLELTIEDVAVDIAPLGWAVFDRDPRFVDVRGADMSISATGALTLPERPERKPLHIGGMALHDVHVTAMASTFLPGLGRTEMTVKRARTGPVRMVSALDWVFVLRELDATAALPAGIDAGVAYADGQLGLSGSLFGSEPVVMPFTLPVPDPDALEGEKLRLLMEAAIENVGKNAAKSWFKSKVTNKLWNLVN